MTKCIGAMVRNGRIDLAAPPDWPDATEVHVCLVFRANLTAKDYGRTVEEMIVIDNLIAKEEELRGSGQDDVVVILDPQLRKLNPIHCKGQEYAFSEANIQSAVLSLKDMLFDGLVRTNEKIYDLLVLGKRLQQTILGDTKSFPLKYIDWNPETWLTNNVFHVTEEFEVERTGTPEQKADLKKKFATTDQLNRAEQKVKEIALDISMHYRDNWKGTPYKAQLVTQGNATALLYKRCLDELGMVTSEVLISGPDDREGHEETDEAKLPEVVAFWKKMMAKYGGEVQYNKNVINAFKSGDNPEIIIVVDKLITGFDAPRNTVLYLT